VYVRVVSRTNIDIDDELINGVMKQWGLRTKREAVDLALRRVYRRPLSTQEALELEGTGWGADGLELSDLRGNYEPWDD
jgi:Arc/MetJ family transcription regulator